MNYIDFHVHIDFYDNPLKIIKEYEEKKIYTLFVTNLPEIFKKHNKKYDTFKYVKLAIGYHPELIDEFSFKKKIFNNFIKKTKYIGEVGLDFSKENIKNKQEQIEIFDYITNPKFNKGRVYSIHSKNAEDDVLRILRKNEVKNAVFHWYSGKISTLNQIVESGYYFSINFNMLKSKKGKKIINDIPEDRLLFETDGPFTKTSYGVVKPPDINKVYTNFETSLLKPKFSELIYDNFRRIIFNRQLDEVE
jgi:TatD DNase family protein